MQNWAESPVIREYDSALELTRKRVTTRVAVNRHGHASI